MSVNPLVVVGAAVAAATLTDRLTAREPEVFRTPPVTSTPEVLAAVRALSVDRVIGVPLESSDGERRDGVITLAPLAPDSPPWRHYAAHRWRLVQTFGGLDLSREVPSLTFRQATAWAAEWSRACDAWLRAADNWSDAERERWRWYADPVRGAIKSLRALAWPNTDERSLWASWLTAEKIAAVAVQMTRGATDAVPAPPPVFVSGWSRVGAAVEGVVGSASDVVGDVLGAAAGGAANLLLGAAGRVLTSPAGAALILGVLIYRGRA